MVSLMSIVGALLLDVISLADIIPGTYRDANAAPSETSIGAYGFFGFCLLFGVVCIITGIYQVWTGRRNGKLIIIILIMGALFAAVGIIARGLG